MVNTVRKRGYVRSCHTAGYHRYGAQCGSGSDDERLRTSIESPGRARARAQRLQGWHVRHSELSGLGHMNHGIISLAMQALGSARQTRADVIPTDHGPMSKAPTLAEHSTHVSPPALLLRDLPPWPEKRSLESIPASWKLSSLSDVRRLSLPWS